MTTPFDYDANPEPLVRLPDRDAVRDYLIAKRVATPVTITKRAR